MQEIHKDVAYRLYKANVGDTVDNKYTILSGCWDTSFEVNPNDKGWFAHEPDYLIIFNDLSDGLYYYIGGRAHFVSTAKSSNKKSACFTEPFTDSYDSFPAREVTYFPQMMSVIRL